MRATPYIRSLETHLPIIQSIRCRIERILRRVTRSVYDSDWLALRKLTLQTGSIVDIGANRGQSIESISFVLPHREIVAFEPNLNLVDALRKTYSRFRNIRIEPFALADSEGQKTLFVPRYRNWTFDGLASLDRKEAVEWLNSDRIKNFNKRCLSCEEMTIMVKTLDEFDLTPALIKLDTQGTEGDVLRGALKTISRTRPAILVESATTAIVDLLAPFDYSPYIFLSGRLLPHRTDSQNVFFLTPRHLVIAAN